MSRQSRRSVMTWRPDELALSQQSNLPQDAQNHVRKCQDLRGCFDRSLRRLHLPCDLRYLLTQHGKVLNGVDDGRILIDDFEIAHHQLLLTTDQLLVLSEETVPVVTGGRKRLRSNCGQGVTELIACAREDVGRS